MPRESLKAKAARCAEVLRRLDAAYPNAHCELNHTNPLELLIATILSAQCTDKQVNIVTAELFKKYRTAADYANAALPQLEQDLRAIGLFRNKAKNIQACSRTLIEHHGGEVPASMEALVQLGGVGRKTANVVLGNAFNINEGVVVDTHVARLSGRLDFTRETKPEKIEAALQTLVPREQWTMVSHWLIWHGRRRCFARNPDCPGCEVKELCPSAFRVSKLASAEKP
ncbi:MAG TPA: endonuclease III [Verrucomicrobiae bacterium]|nr:endonuclease III [Verrucomicrobiae bacterium]